MDKMKDVLDLLYCAKPSKNLDLAMEKVFGDNWNGCDARNFSFVFSFLIERSDKLIKKIRELGKEDLERIRIVRNNYNPSYEDIEFAYNLAVSAIK